jgi:uncharacterized membrane protein
MFDSGESGQQVLAEIASMQKEQIIEIADAALAVKDRRGKVKVTQTLEKMHLVIRFVHNGG